MDVTARARADSAFNDRFEIGDRLGMGGMGSVYRGLQRVLNRPVAIKFMAPELSADRAYVDRFLSEARLAASLVHGSVVAVFDFGLLGDVPYLVTEFVPGATLNDLLKERSTLTVEETLAIARGVLDGLAAIHKLGIVHRDIKPANLLVIPGNPPGVKILDFGIAKQTSGPPLELDAPRTAAGMVMGTPEYMAPEQAAGDRITPAADVYAFALVLYRMIVGQQAFRAESALELLRMQIHKEASVPDTVLPAWREVLLRGLAKRPKDRAGSADEMRALLERAAPDALAAGGFMRGANGAGAGSRLEVPGETAPTPVVSELGTAEAPRARDVETVASVVAPAPPPAPGASAKSVALAALMAGALVFGLRSAPPPPPDTWNHDWVTPFAAVPERTEPTQSDEDLQVKGFYVDTPAGINANDSMHVMNARKLDKGLLQYHLNFKGGKNKYLWTEGFVVTEDGMPVLGEIQTVAWVKTAYAMVDDGGLTVEYGGAAKTGMLELALVGARAGDDERAVIYRLRVDLERPGYEVMVSSPDRCKVEWSHDGRKLFHFDVGCWRMVSRHEVPGLNANGKGLGVEGTVGLHAKDRTLTVTINGVSKPHELGEVYRVKPGALHPRIWCYPGTLLGLRRVTLTGAIVRAGSY